MNETTEYFRNTARINKSVTHQVIINNKPVTLRVLEGDWWEYAYDNDGNILTEQDVQTWFDANKDKFREPQK